MKLIILIICYVGLDTVLFISPIKGHQDESLRAALRTRDHYVRELAWAKETRVKLLMRLIARVDIKQN